MITTRKKTRASNAAGLSSEYIRINGRLQTAPVALAGESSKAITARRVSTRLNVTVTDLQNDGKESDTHGESNCHTALNQQSSANIGANVSPEIISARNTNIKTFDYPAVDTLASKYHNARPIFGWCPRFDAVLSPDCTYALPVLYGFIVDKTNQRQQHDGRKSSTSRQAWSVVPAAVAVRTHVAEQNELSNGEDDNGAEQKEEIPLKRACTARVVQRIAKNLVVCDNGLTYWLIGNVTFYDMDCVRYDETFLKRFSEGFPVGWRMLCISYFKTAYRAEQQYQLIHANHPNADALPDRRHIKREQVEALCYTGESSVMALEKTTTTGSPRASRRASLRSNRFKSVHRNELTETRTSPASELKSIAKPKSGVRRSQKHEQSPAAERSSSSSSERLSRCSSAEQDVQLVNGNKHDDSGHVSSAVAALDDENEAYNDSDNEASNAHEEETEAEADEHAADEVPDKHVQSQSETEILAMNDRKLRQRPERNASTGHDASPSKQSVKQFYTPAIVVPLIHTCRRSIRKQGAINATLQKSSSQQQSTVQPSPCHSGEDADGGGEQLIVAGKNSAANLLPDANSTVAPTLQTPPLSVENDVENEVENEEQHCASVQRADDDDQADDSQTDRDRIAEDFADVGGTLDIDDVPVTVASSPNRRRRQSKDRLVDHLSKTKNMSADLSLKEISAIQPRRSYRVELKKTIAVSLREQSCSPHPKSTFLPPGAPSCPSLLPLPESPPLVLSAEVPPPQKEQEKPRAEDVQEVFFSAKTSYYSAVSSSEDEGETEEEEDEMLQLALHKSLPASPKSPQHNNESDAEVEAEIIAVSVANETIVDRMQPQCVPAVDKMTALFLRQHDDVSADVSQIMDDLILHAENFVHSPGANKDTSNEVFAAEQHASVQPEHAQPIECQGASAAHATSLPSCHTQKRSDAALQQTSVVSTASPPIEKQNQHVESSVKMKGQQRRSPSAAREEGAAISAVLDYLVSRISMDTQPPAAATVSPQGMLPTAYSDDIESRTASNVSHEQSPSPSSTQKEAPSKEVVLAHDDDEQPVIVSSSVSPSSTTVTSVMHSSLNVHTAPQVVASGSENAARQSEVSPAENSVSLSTVSVVLGDTQGVDVDDLVKGVDSQLPGQNDDEELGSEHDELNDEFVAEIRELLEQQNDSCAQVACNTEGATAAAENIFMPTSDFGSFYAPSLHACGTVQDQQQHCAYSCVSQPMHEPQQQQHSAAAYYEVPAVTGDVASAVLHDAMNTAAPNFIVARQQQEQQQQHTWPVAGIRAVAATEQQFVMQPPTVFYEHSVPVVPLRQLHVEQPMQVDNYDAAAAVADQYRQPVYYADWRSRPGVVSRLPVEVQRRMGYCVPPASDAGGSVHTGDFHDLDADRQNGNQHQPQFMIPAYRLTLPEFGVASNYAYENCMQQQIAEPFDSESMYAKKSNNFFGLFSALYESSLLASSHAYVKLRNVVPTDLESFVRQRAASSTHGSVEEEFSRGADVSSKIAGADRNGHRRISVRAVAAAARAERQQNIDGVEDVSDAENNKDDDNTQGDEQNDSDMELRRRYFASARNGNRGGVTKRLNKSKPGAAAAELFSLKRRLSTSGNNNETSKPHNGAEINSADKRAKLDMPMNRKMGKPATPTLQPLGLQQLKHSLLAGRGYSPRIGVSRKVSADNNNNNNNNNRRVVSVMPSVTSPLIVGRSKKAVSFLPSKDGGGGGVTVQKNTPNKKQSNGAVTTVDRGAADYMPVAYAGSRRMLASTASENITVSSPVRFGSRRPAASAGFGGGASGSSNAMVIGEGSTGTPSGSTTTTSSRSNLHYVSNFSTLPVNNNGGRGYLNDATATAAVTQRQRPPANPFLY